MAIKKKVKAQKGPNYDKNGLVKINGVKLDVCDCLEIDCPGCFYPCFKCRSEKCGLQCRRYRKFMYEDFALDGTPNVHVKNPYLPLNFRK